MNEHEKVTGVPDVQDVQEISGTLQEHDTQAAESELQLESETAADETVSSEMTVTDVPENAVIDEDIISSIVEQAMREQAAVTAEETQAVTTAATVVETAPAVSEVVEETVTEAVTEVTEISVPEEPVTETVIEQPAPEGTTSPLTNALLPAMTVGFMAAAAVIAKKASKAKTRGYDDDEDMSARDRDNMRLAARSLKKSKKKKKSGNSDKEKTDFSKKVLSTIPYKKVIADDIFFLGRKMYSKAYTFDDINFNLADEEQQYMYLERYIEFLGILDDTVDCQICCWNSRLNMEDFRSKVLLKQKADDYFDLRHEFNTKVLEANLNKGQNAIQKHMYVTLTVKAPDDETAIRRFKTLDITATNTFNRIGNTGMRVLTAQERIEMLKDFFVGTEDMPVPKLTDEDFKKGREKLYCAPDYFEFKKDYFMFNDTYAKTIYIREFPSTATSDILTGLLGTGAEIMVTTNEEQTLRYIINSCKIGIYAVLIYRSLAATALIYAVCGESLFMSVCVSQQFRQIYSIFLFSEFSHRQLSRVREREFYL